MDKSINHLNQIFKDGEQVDKELFAEQRSNVNLTIGNHYPKQNDIISRFARSQKVSKSKALRLTKNHTHVITSKTVNHITSKRPGVGITPKSDSELSDKKAAELNLAVWSDICHRHKMDDLINKFAYDFVVLGEIIAKVGFDLNRGRFIGHEPVLGELGEVIGENPVFSGDHVLERIEAFNLIRDPSSKYFEDSSWYCYRKMVDKHSLLKAFEGDEEKRGYVQAASKDTFTIFDTARGSYDQTKDKVQIREFYFRPTPDEPTGYFFITAESHGVLYEGPIPLGDKYFPIIRRGYLEVPTCPRAYSIIKQLRPYQAEINRTASAIAQSQISFSDKLLLHSGTTVSHGAIGGAQTYKYTGSKPEFHPGATGDGYLGYMNSQIDEMYRVANIREDAAEKNPNLDPHALLFRSIKDKKQFSYYTDKFESFLVEFAQTALAYAKEFYTEHNLVPAIGKREAINIDEFKATDELCYQIKVEAQTTDVETELGQQLALNHVLQFSGGQLDKEDIGNIISNMPYIKDKSMFNDITLNARKVENILLALDRGRPPQPNKYDNHKYIIKKLSSAMGEVSFAYKDPQIQMLYQQCIAAHEQMEAQNAMEIQRAQAGFIPAGGGMIAVSMRVEGSDTNIRMPYESLEWLYNKLSEQGSMQQEISEQVENQGAIADIASYVNPMASQPLQQADLQPEIQGAM